MILLNFHADRVRIRGLRAVFALAVLALGACAPAPVRPPPPPLDAAQQAANEARLGDEWGFHGKVALSQGANGGSANIRWRQLKDDFEIELSAPITRQSWRLSSRGGRLRVEGLEGGAREGNDAEALLLEATWLADSGRGDARLGARNARAPRQRRLQLDPPGAGRRCARMAGRSSTAAGSRRSAAAADGVRAPGEASVRLVVERWDAP
jgi:outer membrane lipoprotein LolB